MPNSMISKHVTAFLSVMSLALAAPWAFSQSAVLLIPESATDTIQKFDPMDGTHLGQFAAVPLMFGTISTPISAVKGPDNRVYVSDQVQDAVFRFDMNGNFIDVFVSGAAAGLDNIRGIDFLGNDLLVSNSPTGSVNDCIARFAPDRTRLPNLIQDGSDPFDVLVLSDGRLLVADIAGTTDSVRLYNADGSFNRIVFPVDFPEQIQPDPVLPGAFLNAAFSANRITDFDLDGTIIRTSTLSGARGIYRLGNGNLLATNSSGVLEIDATTGAVIQTERAGTAHFIELVTFAPPPCPGDLNGDRLVNQADLGILLAAFGVSGGGDLDDDGDTDQADLGVLLANFGASCP